MYFQGIAYIEYESEKDASKAIMICDGSKLDGAAIQVRKILNKFKYSFIIKVQSIIMICNGSKLDGAAIQVNSHNF